MPNCKTCENEANDSSDDGEEDPVHRCKVVHGVAAGVSSRAHGEEFFVNLIAGYGETNDTEQGYVDKEEEEGFIVVKTETVCEPWTVVVHFKDAGSARRAMVRAVGFAELTFFAEAVLAIGLNGDAEGGRVRDGEMGVAVALVREMLDGKGAIGRIRWSSHCRKVTRA